MTQTHKDRLRSILVGFDGFEHGEPLPALARSLAVEHGAALRVVHVVPELPTRKRFGDVDVVELQQALIDSRQNKLDSLVASMERSGVRTSVVIRTGRPAAELIREAVSGGDDLLIVTDEPKGRGDARGFGAVTTRLLRNCPCPVLADRGPLTYKHNRIMAAVDLDVDSPEPVLPNHQVLELAVLLARQAGARLDVFHAWSVWGEHLLRSRSPTQEVDALVADHQGAVENELQALIASHDTEGLDVRAVLTKGEPRRLIPGYVAAENIDLLVMGTVGRTGISGAVIGNTAERILNRVECSVLAVKPPDFQSPVR